MTDESDDNIHNGKTATHAAMVYIKYGQTGELLGAKLVGRGVPPRGYLRCEVTPDGEVRQAK